MRHAKSEEAAKRAANFLREKLKIDHAPVGIVLGTGWGEALEFHDRRGVFFQEIPGFGSLDPLEGHAREVVFGFLKAQNGDWDTHPVIALRGRVHVNERPADPDLYGMVRLQIEMLLQLGVKTLILTCAAGSLRADIDVGNVVLIDGFATIYAPIMPGFAGEFRSPEDTIDTELQTTFCAAYRGSLRLGRGGHVMVPGPFFEGRKYDKPIMRNLHPGIAVVGMSVLPEASIASLYDGVKTLPLAFVTNTDSEEHSHEENQRRAKEKSPHLGDLLEQIVSLIARRA